MKRTDKIAEALMSESKKKTVESSDFLSTGSTLLNLACSDRAFGGFMKGKYFFLVGDSTSGKTFLSMTCFAEAARNKKFADYRLIYDNVEDGMLMDVDQLFGEKTGDKIEPPATDENDDAVFSSTIEEFYYHLDDAIKQNEPFVYILDSMDGLSSEAEGDKFDQQKKAHRDGKNSAGSYGDGKAKKNSAGLRKAMNGIRDTGSILIIICQTRDNIGGGPFSGKTRSGGRALRFYATVEIWTALGGQIKKQVKGKQRKIGDKIKIRIKKNRITGKLPEIETQIYPSYGIDDIGSCIDYLVAEKWWKKSGKTITTKEFGAFTREKLIAHIEANSKRVKKLQRITGKCWREIDNQCSLDRKSRY